MPLTKVKRNFRFYPSKEQKTSLAKVFGCSRLIYNKALEWRIQSYKDGQKPSYNSSSSWLTDLKKIKEFSFLNDVSCVPLQQSLRHLQSAYSSFFKGSSKFPKFKKKNNRQSCEFTRRAFTFKNGTLSLAKIGELKVKWSCKTENPSSVTVIKTASGKYYVSLTVEEKKTPLPKSSNQVGVDLGITTFATLSTGEKIKAPKKIRKQRSKLARLQKSHSRKKSGSNNQEKARIKVARCHEQTTNIRKDFLHKLSSWLINENQVISLEDLNVSGMIKNKKLARAISEQGFREFRSMLEYKAQWFGREFRLCNRWFPSSKTCSVCGKKTTLKLSDRVWKCSCGVKHDRDINAAKNILAAGQAVTACGDSVRLTSVSVRQRSKNRPIGLLI